MSKATFAAGCFWGVEAAFRKLEGVTATRVGYTGGRTRNPTYRQVCSHTTGHAEAVEVVYDPGQISYEELLHVFWGLHDPTVPPGREADPDSQYRSAIFYHREEQKNAAEASREALEASGKYARPIATRIVPAETFWPAEDYHQQYYEKRGAGGCPAP
jgi:peptide-methionine (S)-S-oxide reductase